MITLWLHFHVFYKLFMYFELSPEAVFLHYGYIIAYKALRKALFQAVIGHFFYFYVILFIFL